MASNSRSAGHGACALSNLALLDTGRALLSGWMLLWVLVAAPALSGISLLLILKLSAPRQRRRSRSIIWMLSYACYVVGLECLFWLLGGVLAG